MSKPTRWSLNKIENRPCQETLTVESIIAIHEHLARAFASENDPISPSGVKDKNLLEMATSRQHVGFDGISKYPTALLNAATLMYGLCNDHPFYNGNKRTALIAGIMHLDSNGLVLADVTRDELYDFMLKIANHDVVVKSATGPTKINADEEVRSIAEWLTKRTRKITRGERVITYRELIQILKKFSHLRVDDSGFYVYVYRKTGLRLFGWEREARYTFTNPDDHGDVSIARIKGIREALLLTEANGIDSTAFYDTQSSIDDFITRHRGVLRRLARV